MSLAIAMLPIYILGNLHCLGMCGPIAMLLGKSPYRGYYLLGRLISFTLAGTLAGAFGQVIGALLATFHLSGALSIAMGILMCLLGAQVLFNWSFLSLGMAKKFAPLQDSMNQWLFSEKPGPLFLVGFFTIALPCGQTLLVYSAAALSGSASVGTLNGLLFALLTTPSLYLAMQANGLIQRVKKWYRPVVGAMSIAIGLFALLRGMAEFGMIPHVGIHPFMIY